MPRILSRAFQFTYERSGKGISKGKSRIRWMTDGSYVYRKPNESLIIQIKTLKLYTLKSTNWARHKACILFIFCIDSARVLIYMATFLTGPLRKQSS